MKTKQQMRKILKDEVAKEEEYGIKNVWWVTTVEYNQWKNEKEEWVRDVMREVDETVSHLDYLEDIAQENDCEGGWTKLEIKERVKRRIVERHGAEENILEEAINNTDLTLEDEEDFI